MARGIPSNQPSERRRPSPIPPCSSRTRDCWPGPVRRQGHRLLDGPRQWLHPHVARQGKGSARRSRQPRRAALDWWRPSLTDHHDAARRRPPSTHRPAGLAVVQHDQTVMSSHAARPWSRRPPRPVTRPGRTPRRPRTRRRRRLRRDTGPPTRRRRRSPAQRPAQLGVPGASCPAARPGHGDEAGSPDQIAHLVDLRSSPNETRRAA